MPRLEEPSSGGGGTSDHDSLSNVSADDHHTEDHETRHASGGDDALSGNLDAVAKTTVRKNTGADVGSRRRLNFIEGSNVTLTVTDDAGNEEVDITIAAPSGSGPHVIKQNGSGLTARAGLNFAEGVVASDDAGNDETDVNVDWAASGDLANVGTSNSAGTGTKVPRADHTHNHGTQTTDIHTNYMQEFCQTFSKGGTLTTGTGTFRWYAKGAWTITQVRASVGTQPTGASILIDVNKGGTTIFTTQSNRPTIAVSTNTDLADAINVTSVADGDFITVDIDQVGSTIAGADLTVQVWLKR